MVFASRTSFRGLDDQALGEQREDEAKELLTVGLGTSRVGSACSISLRSWRLPWPLRATRCFSTCFQAGPVRSVAKRSSCGHQVHDGLIDGGARRIEQTQRLCLEGVRQTDGESKRLRLGHGYSAFAPGSCSAMTCFAHSTRAAFLRERRPSVCLQTRR